MEGSGRSIWERRFSVWSFCLRPNLPEAAPRAGAGAGVDVAPASGSCGAKWGGRGRALWAAGSESSGFWVSHVPQSYPSWGRWWVVCVCLVCMSRLYVAHMFTYGGQWLRAAGRRRPLVPRYFWAPGTSGASALEVRASAPRRGFEGTSGLLSSGVMRQTWE